MQRRVSPIALLPLTVGLPLAVSTAPAQAQLIHRYSFDGSGTTALDSAGTADGVLLGGSSLTGTGVLDLDGVDDYVELPSGMLAGLTDATFEAWVTWSGGGDWQRIFDFGDSSGGPGNQGSGLTYIVLSPQSSQGVPTGAVRTGATSTHVYGGAAATTGVVAHYAYVFDGVNDSMSLYIDGVFQNTSATTDDLAGINDVNNWLGRSQFSANPHLSGSIAEFRIHDAALDQAAVTASYTAGPGGAGSTVGTSYCGPAIPNSTAQPGSITGTGTASILLNDLELIASQLPAGQFGIFLCSQTQGFVNPPSSSGILCLAGTIGPFHLASNIIQGPTGSIAVDVSAMPVMPVQAVLPGDTWSFQCWYRDAGNTNNFTDGLSVTFL